MKKIKYKNNCSSFVVVRETLKPLAWGKPYLENPMTIQIAESYLDDEEFRTGLALAAPNLLNTFLDKERKYDVNKFSDTIFKYMNRCSYRTVPFGFFSKVLIGEKSDCKEYLEPSYNWIDSLVKELIKDEVFLREQSFVINPTLQRKGKFYSVINSINDNPVIVANDLNEFIFKNINEEVPVKSLIYEITKSSDEIDESVVLKYIKKLIDYEFIYLVDLNTLNCSNLNNVKSLIKNLEQIDHKSKRMNDILNNLKLISKKISDSPCYQDSEVLDLYQLCKETNQKNSVNDLYGFIIGGKNKKPEYRKFVKSGEKLLNYLGSFTNSLLKKESNSSYIQSFIEKYGYCEVPLFQLIDESAGLGYPRPESEKKENDIVYQIERNLLNRLRTNCDEIDLKEIMPKILENNLSMEKEIDYLNESCELFFLNFSGDSKEVYLAPTIISQNVGNSVGRFTHGLNENVNSEYSKFLNEVQEEYEKNGVLPVTVTYIPKKSFLMDLKERNIYTNFICSISGYTHWDQDCILDLKDIMVGVESERSLYFRSKKFNKKIVFLDNTNLNRGFKNDLCNFLVEYSNKHTPLHILGMIQRQLDIFKEKPRIVLDEVIISLKSITVTKEDLNDLPSKISNYFGSKYFYFKENDNRLLLNSENSQHINIVKKVINKNGYALLTEVESDLEKELTNENNDISEKYIQELIIPFIKNSDLVSERKLKISDSIFFDRKEKEFIPGSKWSYIKFNIHKSMQDSFIKEGISGLKKMCQEHYPEIISFFIRYVDNGKNSIRIRFKDEDNKEIYKFLIDKINEFGGSNISLDTYEQEVERYGGLEAIEYAERYFSSETKVVTWLLGKVNKTTKDIIAIAYLFLLFNTFFEQEENRTEYLKQYRLKESNKYIRNNKKQISEEIDLMIKSTLIKNSMKDLKEYKKVIDGASQSLDLKPERICFSLCHMFINRFIGIDQKREKKIMGALLGFQNYYIHSNLELKNELFEDN